MLMVRKEEERFLQQQVECACRHRAPDLTLPTPASLRVRLGHKGRKGNLCLTGKAYLLSWAAGCLELLYSEFGFPSQGYQQGSILP